MLSPVFTLSPLLTLESARAALAGVFFLYLALLLGGLLLRALRITFDTTLERVAYATIIGLGVWGLIGFSAAVLGIFTPALLWAAAACILLFARRDVRAHTRALRSLPRAGETQSIKARFLSYTALKFLILLWLALNAALIFVPLTGHDTLDYHYPIIESIARNQGLSVGLESTPIPFFGEIIYAVPTTLFGETGRLIKGPGEKGSEKNAIEGPFAFQLVQWSTMPFLLIVLYGAAQRHLRQSFLPFMLVLLVLSLMDLWREVFHGGYVDMLAYLFGAASILLLFKEAAAPRDNKMLNIRCLTVSTVALAGILLGFALAVKYHALFFALAGGGLLLAALRQRRLPLRTARTLLLTFVLTTMLVSSFWYLKNTFVHGNPVYPMFSDTRATSDVNTFLADRTVKNFLAFPYLRYAGAFTQENESSSRLIIFGYFVLFALLVPITLLLQRRWSRPTVLAVLLFLALYTMTFLTSHQHRFLLPSQISLAFALTFLIDERFSWLATRRFPLYKTLRRLAPALLPIIFFIVFLGNIHYFYVRWQYMLGILDTEGYIADIGSQ
ncbi:MAG: hypothetical protein U1A28_04395 [Patescibacteria group bacterium]|nr:hypothetical protein [Patescibacteria group bacterium]